MSNNLVGRAMLSQSKFYMGYSRWLDLEQRYETYEESVERVMNMHREKYKEKLTDELEELISFVEQAYKDKLILGAQRGLQFGGEQILKKNMRFYNCSVSYVDRPRFFQECMYMLLCGCGVGFSIQKHHISKLPKIKKRFEKKTKIFTVPDSVEGWSDAFGVLLSSYFEGGGEFPEYEGCQVHFDFSKIRPKGSQISGGFKAPGPDGLRHSLVKCEELLDNLIGDSKEPVQIKPITAYDYIMHMSDAVLSGGVRRSATIALFSKDDEEMMKAKTGDWYTTNPQRARSNNSVILLRDEITKEEFMKIIENVKQSGEPGFVFTDSLEFCFNPLKLAA